MAESPPGNRLDESTAGGSSHHQEKEGRVTPERGRVKSLSGNRLDESPTYSRRVEGKKNKHSYNINFNTSLP